MRKVRKSLISHLLVSGPPRCSRRVRSILCCASRREFRTLRLADRPGALTLVPPVKDERSLASLILCIVSQTAAFATCSPGLTRTATFCFLLFKPQQFAGVFLIDLLLIVNRRRNVVDNANRLPDKTGAFLRIERHVGSKEHMIR